MSGPSHKKGHFQMQPIEERYDAIVIGAGQAGGPLSTALAQAGYKTALVEREHVGGTCVNEGCSPTKTMVASARVAYVADRAADFGVQDGPVSIDMARVRQRKRDIVDSFRNGSRRRIENTDGLDLIFGETRFCGPKCVEVSLNDGEIRRLIADRYVFINTGNRPGRPPVPGLDQVPMIDSTSIMELENVPEHLLVLGGGYVGLEFGQMFRRFGSRVTIIQRTGQLLGREDADVASAVLKVMEQDGIEILLDARATHVGQADGEIRLEVQQRGRAAILVGSHL